MTNITPSGNTKINGLQYDLTILGMWDLCNPTEVRSTKNPQQQRLSRLGPVHQQKQTSEPMRNQRSNRKGSDWPLPTSSGIGQSRSGPE
ncbi:hypothetical protein O181_129256 [Austropuccinia psidii MF-1]|uniref:Uncharacterized protein n=1 Tax=Austropuccinia psidii MF-1 TaxID=1389203 RepID=A0A9Q3L0H6_9BASI|nr:hypothetical protein [Austropuccinia psidii MF-1]